jgi:REP element-mobilizing transposase RayT
LKTFNYIGKHRYFVTCSTEGRSKRFTDAAIASELAEQIVRTCTQRQFEVLAYVFMDDHLHLLIEGLSDDSDFKSTMTLLRQRTALAYSRARKERLWQDGYFERVLRRNDPVAKFIAYIEDNPVTAGFPEERTQYPYVWTITRSAPL